jgi:uncharacterized protein YndB with AHSA1/START domain
MTNSQTDAATAPVVRAVHVSRPPEEAFAVFTEDIGSWWPMETHSVFGATARVAVEDREIVEHSQVGERTVWAKIVEWDPPRRLALRWHPGTDPVASTMVEVDFTPEDSGTRVQLTHVGWEALGERAQEARDSYHEGWVPVLQCFVVDAAGERT